MTKSDVIVYSAYGPKRPRKPQLFVGPSMTRQEFKDNGNCDVLVERASRGLPVDLNQRASMFADVSKTPSYQEAQNIIIKADLAFKALPSKVRTRFHNDPGQLLEFINDPSNRDEALKLGLLKPVEASPVGTLPSTPPVLPAEPLSKDPKDLKGKGA